MALPGVSIASHKVHGKGRGPAYVALLGCIGKGVARVWAAGEVRAFVGEGEAVFGRELD